MTDTADLKTLEERALPGATSGRSREKGPRRALV